MATSKQKTHELTVKFGPVSIKEHVISVPFGIPRMELSSSDADEALINRTLSMRISFDPNSGGDIEGQQTLEGHDQTVIDVTGQVRGGHSRDEAKYSATIAFLKSEVDPAEIAQLATKAADVVVTLGGAADE